MNIPAKLNGQLVDGLMALPSNQATPIVTHQHEGDQHEGIERSFGKRKDLWIVTKGKGWKARPKHLVTKATWQLPTKEWSTACGWAFAQHSSEFYFLTGKQVDELKCQKREA